MALVVAVGLALSRTASASRRVRRQPAAGSIAAVSSRRLYTVYLYKNEFNTRYRYFTKEPLPVVFKVEKANYLKVLEKLSRANNDHTNVPQ